MKKMMKGKKVVFSLLATMVVLLVTGVMVQLGINSRAASEAYATLSATETTPDVGLDVSWGAEVEPRLEDAFGPLTNGFGGPGITEAYIRITNTLTGDIRELELTYGYAFSNSEAEFGGGLISVGKHLGTMEFGSLGLYEGTYTVKVIVNTSFSANGYEERSFVFESGETSFKLRTDPFANLTISDCYVGETPEVIVYAYNGTVTFTSVDERIISYRLASNPIGEYTPGLPTEAGEYIVRLEAYTAVAEKPFNILKREGSGTINLTKTEYIYTASPVILENSIQSSTNGTDNCILEYKLATEADTKYTTTAPTVVGNYTVRVTFKETEMYKAAYATGNFSIIKDKGDFTFSIADIIVGQTLNPTATVIKGSSELIYEFKKKGEGDNSYTTAIPTEAGSYVGRCTQPETDFFEKVQKTVEFQIIGKSEGSGKLEIKSFTYGMGKINPVITSDTNPTDTMEIIYRKAGASNSDFLEKEPTKPGKYEAIAFLEESELYLPLELKTTFEIYKAAGNGLITVEDVLYGIEVKPEYSTTMTVSRTPVIEYKLKTESDDKYTTKKPEEVGQYVARLTYPESDYYYMVRMTDDFSISYMLPPEYKVSGTKGENDYYISNVTITAPEGYAVSAVLKGTYLSAISYNETRMLEKVYFKNVKTGAMSNGVLLKPVKIDTVKPVFRDHSSEALVYSDLYEFSAYDLNLSSVTVNGSAIDKEEDNANISLDADGGITEYEVVVKDKAGNETVLKFTLAASWLQEKIVPADKQISLEAAVEYHLENDGTWTVEGDSTQYKGGMAVYSKDGGRYVFSKS